MQVEKLATFDRKIRSLPVKQPTFASTTFCFHPNPGYATDSFTLENFIKHIITITQINP